MTILKGVAFVFSLALIGSAFIIGLLARQNWGEMTVENRVAAVTMTLASLLGGILLVVRVSQ